VERDGKIDPGFIRVFGKWGKEGEEESFGEGIWGRNRHPMMFWEANI